MRSTAYVIRCRASGTVVVTPLRSKKGGQDQNGKRLPAKGSLSYVDVDDKPPQTSILHAHSSAPRPPGKSGKTDEARHRRFAPEFHLIRCRHSPSCSTPLPLPCNLDWTRPTRSLLTPSTTYSSLFACLWNTARLMAGDRPSNFRRDRSADPFSG